MKALLTSIVLLLGIAAFGDIRTELLERAETADADELNRISMAFESGLPQLEPDSALALDLLKRSAEMGSLDAINYLGYKLLTGSGIERSEQEGLQLIEKAAALGYPKAYNNLGWLLTDGEYVERDYNKALFWLRKGADAGVAPSMLLLGDYYRTGIGLERPDTLVADSLYRAAALKKFPDAQWRLIEMNGDRYTAMNANSALQLAYDMIAGNAPAVAALLAQTAAEKGSPDGEALSGYMTSTGTGTRRDPVQGLQLLFNAAAHGNNPAQFIIAETLDMTPDELDLIDTSAASGLTPEEISSPHYWYERAAEGGIYDAAKAVATILGRMKKSAPAQDFILGADISGVSALEAHGRKILDADGNETDLFLLMKDYGMPGVRLRVWVDPKDGFCSPSDVVEMARRAKAADMPVMIDFHYSDWWADPGKQNIPDRWKEMNYEEMKGALAEHTASTLQMLRNEGIDVKWIQIGNETTNGMLWPVGKTDENMVQYAGLTKAGYDAAKQIFPDTPVIVHLDNGFDADLYNRIFDALKANGAQWDMIGMSIYPYWGIQYNHVKDEDEILERSIANIKALKQKYGTGTMIVETGVEAAKPEEGKRFMQRLLYAAANDTDGACRGVWYWAPEADGALEHYPLGAFMNGRPTVILDAFREFRK